MGVCGDLIMTYPNPYYIYLRGAKSGVSQAVGPVLWSLWDGPRLRNTRQMSNHRSIAFWLQAFGRILVLSKGMVVMRRRSTVDTKV